MRLSPTLGVGRLAAIREVHMNGGAHRVYRTPLREWLSAAVRAKAARLTLGEARAQLAAASR